MQHTGEVFCLELILVCLTWKITVCVHKLNHLLSSLLGRQSPGARKYTGPEHNTVKRVLRTRAEGTKGVYRTLTTSNVNGEGLKLIYDDLLYLFF